MRKGSKHTKEAIEKIMKSNLGKNLSDETKRKMKGRNPFNKGKKLSLWMTKKSNKLRKKKISKTMKIRRKERKEKLGYINSPKTIIKIKKSIIKLYSERPELKKQISKTLKITYKKHPEIIEKQKQTRMKTLRDNPDIEKERIKNIKKAYKENPEIIEKQQQGRRKIMKQIIKKRKQTLKNNPQIMKNIARKCSKTKNSKRWQNTIGQDFRKKISAIQQGIDIKDWKGFISKEPYDEKWTNKFKRIIRKRDNQICMLCKIHREKLKEALSIHHINYNKKLTVLQNCVSLCRNCHTKTRVNKEHWIKFFQSLLSERYGYNYDNNQNIILEFKNEN